jgi:hypothetical protein
VNGFLFQFVVSPVVLVLRVNRQGVLHSRDRWAVGARPAGDYPLSEWHLRESESG